MRVSYGFLGLIGVSSAFLLFLFALITVKPGTDDPAANGTDRMVTPLTAPIVEFGNPSRGSRTAPVTIIEYGDYQCAPCASLAATLDAVLAARPNDVRLVWKDLPNPTMHVASQNAAIAARCAGDQGAYWEYHDLLFIGQSDLSDGALRAYAAILGLDEPAFTECQTSGRMVPLIERDMEEAFRLGLDATPFLFIGDKRFSGALGQDALNAAIDQAVATSRTTP